MACCEELEQVLEKFELPFFYPVQINMETLGFAPLGLAVKLLQTTRTGRITATGGMEIFIRYCPWCGVKLREEEKK